MFAISFRPCCHHRSSFLGYKAPARYGEIGLFRYGVGEFSILFSDVQQIMNRHRFGEKHGISVEDIKYSYLDTSFVSRWCWLQKPLRREFQVKISYSCEQTLDLDFILTILYSSWPPSMSLANSVLMPHIAIWTSTNSETEKNLSWSVPSVKLKLEFATLSVRKTSCRRFSGIRLVPAGIPSILTIYNGKLSPNHHLNLI